MSHNYYSEINLHIVWHTKESAALLTPEIEPAAWQFLRKRIVAIKKSITRTGARLNVWSGSRRTTIERATPEWLKPIWREGP